MEKTHDFGAKIGHDFSRKNWKNSHDLRLTSFMYRLEIKDPVKILEKKKTQRRTWMIRIEVKSNTYKKETKIIFGQNIQVCNIASKWIVTYRN